MPINTDVVSSNLDQGEVYNIKTNKTDRHDITEILLKVALNTINQAHLRRQSKDITKWEKVMKTTDGLLQFAIKMKYTNKQQRDWTIGKYTNKQQREWTKGKYTNKQQRDWTKGNAYNTSFPRFSSDCILTSSLQNCHQLVYSNDKAAID